MMFARTTPILATLVAALLIVPACGGSDDDGSDSDAAASDGGGDGSTGSDAGIDAMASALGQPCTGTGQGSCPTGFECISFTGSTGSWCSKTCTDINDTSCADGYTGTGLPMCLFSIGPSGGPTQNYCTVFCLDEPGGPDICASTQCTGACPGNLMCTATIGLQGSNDPAGQACQ